MIPLYRPGTVPRSVASGIQKRVVTHISQPFHAPLLPTSRDEVLPTPPMAVASPRINSSAKRQLSVWIGGSILIFWVILMTLFFISHIIGSKDLSTAIIASRHYNFTLIPTRGRFQNVSLEKSHVMRMVWHRTCCWQHSSLELHCDGSGMFSTHVDRKEFSLIVRVIQLDIIGAHCTFHGF